MSLIFGKPKTPKVEKIDPSEDARELRRRIAARGGEQTTILTGLLSGNGANAGANVFKKNLAGTGRKR